MDAIIDNPINIGKLLYESTMNNKSIFLSTIPLFTGYYLQDTVFTRSLANITTDIPAFFKGISINKVFWAISPYLGAMLLFYISNVMSSKILTNIELDFTNNLTEQIIESVKNTKKQIDVNELMVHIKKLSETKGIYRIFVNYFAPTIIIGCTLIYYFVRADIKYGTMIIMIIAMMILLTIYIESNTLESVYTSEKSLDEMYDYVHEIILNLDSIITSNTNETEINNLKKKSDITYEKVVCSELVNYNISYFLYILSICAMLLINYMAYRMHEKKSIDTSMFVSTVLLTILFMDYYIYCIGAFMELVSSVGKYYESYDYFGEFKEATKKEANKKDMVITKGEIVFKNINQKYGDTVIFKNMNLKLEGGKKYGLIGPIGSGKTTLLKMLSGIVSYDGEIYVDSQSFDDVNDQSISQNIAYISQYPKLFNKTIYENISYGTGLTKEQTFELLKDFDLMVFINRFPDKLDTIVGKEGSKVSGGQRQFLAFTRALIQNKKIIVLDEPSSSLDIETKQILINTIKKLKNRTIIISTHDHQLNVVFDRMIDVKKL